MFLGVLHTGFSVSDLDRSVHWYTEVLGLRLLKRQHNDNRYTRTLVGMPEAVLEIAFLGFPEGRSVPSGPVLELISYLSPPGRSEVPPTNDVGSGHLALSVADLRGKYRKLRALGVSFRSPPVEITEGANAGARACYLSDPDGITIELIQPADGRTQS
jgi:catechol 2,3-dioxygenase-like lactoylglutathione lyase family enzyme